ncbi:DUF6799 domain-containing protein [Marivirga sp.]|uniref:DUF6799 domain-containing protein n=1 Tax=Marivirga sp. TaxID=2018662 RepID=UPI002D7FEF9E|nr:DUF6799 domain-containing protein [Marivirga sp.]HET8859337.1 DUF6799 domain-containing protein [Marivirga sp.]
MKTIILSIATVIITTGAYAQTNPAIKPVEHSINSYYVEPTNLFPPDGFMLQNGQLVMVINGEMTPLEKDTTLTNGTIVMTDGHYMKKNEQKMMFQEGEHMDMSGKMTSKNSTTGNYESDGKNFPNGYLYKNGQMMKVKNGVMSPLEQNVKLIDGTIIMRNSYYMRDGEERMKFEEGEHMDMSGMMSKPQKEDEMHDKNKDHQESDTTKNYDY